MNDETGKQIAATLKGIESSLETVSGLMFSLVLATWMTAMCTGLR